MTVPVPTGLLNIHKPAGLTSRAVVDRVVWLLRRMTGQKKIRAGHCGTLDPLATGVLVVCLGQATRLVSLVQEQQKTYRGRFMLGRRTDTDDITGQVLSEGDASAVTVAQLEVLLPEFTGRIAQRPPLFSAVHVEGQRAYDLARRGEEVALAAREVDVFRLELTGWQAPEFELLIECGSGTYVRSLGRDIGERLGCGATMTALVREAIGPFCLASAVPLEELTTENLLQHLRPSVDAVRHLPARIATEPELLHIRTGRSIDADERTNEPRYAVLHPCGTLVAVAHRTDGELHPKIVFADATDGSMPPDN